MICPLCGKEAGGLCLECSLKLNPLSLKKKLAIKACKCGRLRLNYWFFAENFWRRLEGLLPKLLSLPEGCGLEEVRVVSKSSNRGKVSLALELGLRKGGEKRSVPFDLSFPLERSCCDLCSKRASGYYEAILQLRGKGDVRIKESWLSRVEEVKGGRDYYFLSSSQALRVARQLFERGWEVKVAKQLWGVKAGKRVYRLAISAKEPPFREGDLISYRGKALRVLKLGKRAVCLDLRSGKTLYFSTSELTKAWKKPELLVEEGIVSVSTPSSVEVLDLRSHESFSIENYSSWKELKTGERVKVIADKRGPIVLKL